jgi:predicted nucleic acid-binding Zn ribbon protein
VQPLRLLDDLQQLVVGPHALEVLRDGARGLRQRVCSEECLDLVSFLRRAEATEMTLLSSVLAC